jgi:hypothetical protein
MQLPMDRHPGSLIDDSQIGADLDVIVCFGLATAADRVTRVSPWVALVVLDDRTTDFVREELSHVEDAITGDDDFHTIPTSDPGLVLGERIRVRDCEKRLTHSLNVASSEAGQDGDKIGPRTAPLQLRLGRFICDVMHGVRVERGASVSP